MTYTNSFFLNFDQDRLISLKVDTNFDLLLYIILIWLLKVNFWSIFIPRFVCFFATFFRIEFIKVSRWKFLYDLYIFFFGGPLTCVDESVWWPEMPVAKLWENLKKFFLLFRIQIANLDWWQVGLFIRHERAKTYIKSVKWWFSGVLRKSLIKIIFSCLG